LNAQVKVYPLTPTTQQRPLIYPTVIARLTQHLHSHTGGWNPQTGSFAKEINAQIDLAFQNVDINLKDAGGKGWSQVFRVNSYHVPINNEAMDAMVRNFRKWMPEHQPLWTCVGVARLGEDDMRVEIEVVAHDPEGVCGR
jgi:enamine deaminase RidA (YjgF/YER057c/UK114 family)